MAESPASVYTPCVFVGFNAEGHPVVGDSHKLPRGVTTTILVCSAQSGRVDPDFAFPDEDAHMYLKLMRGVPWHVAFFDPNTPCCVFSLEPYMNNGIPAVRLQMVSCRFPCSGAEVHVPFNYLRAINPAWPVPKAGCRYIREVEGRWTPVVPDTRACANALFRDNLLRGMVPDSQYPENKDAPPFCLWPEENQCHGIYATFRADGAHILVIVRSSLLLSTDFFITFRI